MAALIVVDGNMLDGRAWYLYHRQERSGWKALGPKK
jgi:hypothetical protein